MYLDELTWKPLPEGESYEEVAKLLRRPLATVRETIVVDGDAAQLSFYPGGALCRYKIWSRFSAHELDPLLVLRVPTEQAADAGGAEKPTARFWLDGESDGIHGANERCKIRLTSETVIDYLRFFCFAVRGGDGAFNIVERPQPNIKYPEGTERMLRPFEPEPERDEKGRFRATGVVAYGGDLFWSEFAVTTDGLVEMVDDSPLADGTVSDPEMGIPRLDGKAVAAEVRQRMRWEPLPQDTMPALVSAVREFFRITRSPLSPASQRAGQWSKEFPSCRLKFERWSQRFLRGAEIIRLTRMESEKEEWTCTFIWQRVLRSLPSCLPITRYPANLYAYLHSVGLDAALEASPESWKQLLALIDVETPLDDEPADLLHSTHPAAEAYTSFLDLPVDLQSRLCRAIERWTARDDQLLFLLAVADRLLERTPVQLREVRSTQLAFLRDWCRASMDAEPPPAPALRFGAQRVASGDAKTEIFCLEQSSGQKLAYEVSWVTPTEPTATLGSGLLADKLTYAVMDDLGKRTTEIEWRAAILEHVVGNLEASALARESPALAKKVADLLTRVRPVVAKRSAGSPDDPLVTFAVRNTSEGGTASWAAGVFLVKQGAGPDPQSDTELFADHVKIEAGSVVKGERLLREEVASWREDGQRLPPRLAAPRLASPAELTIQSRRAFAEVICASSPSEVIDDAALKGKIQDDDVFVLKGVVVKGDLVLGKPHYGSGPAAPRGKAFQEIRLEDCRIEGDLVLDGVTVEGDCTLRSVSIGRGISANQVLIRKNFRLEDVHVEAATEERVALTAQQIRIEGGLVLQGCCFEGSVLFNYLEAKYVWLWLVWCVTWDIVRAVIEPGSIATNSDTPTVPEDLEVFGLLCEKSAQLSAIKIEGVLRLDGVAVAGDLSLDALDLDEDLQIGLPSQAPSRVGGRLSIGNSEIGGAVRVQNGFLRSFHISRSSADAVILSSSHDVNADAGSTVVGDVELFDSKVPRGLRCQALEVTRALRVERCQLGNIDLDGQLSARAWSTAGYDNVADSRMLYPTRVEEGVEIRSNQVDGSIQFLACLIRRKTEEVQPALEISATTVGRHIMFWTGRYCENVNAYSVVRGLKSLDLVPEIEAFQPAGLTYGPRRVLGRRSLGGWRVLGREPAKKDSERAEASDPRGPKSLEAPRSRGLGLDPTDRKRLELRQTAARVATRVDGRVRINQCTVSGDVRISNLRAPGQDVDLLGLRVAGNIRADSKDERYGHWTSDGADTRSERDEEAVTPKTTCRSLTIDKCRIEGAVELMGLEAGVAASSMEVKERRDDPVLRVSYTTVAETLSLVHLPLDDRARPKGPIATKKEPSGPHFKPSSQATLHGRLDVSGSNFGTIRLSGTTWSKGAFGRRSDNLLGALTADPDGHELEPLIRGEGTVFERIDFVYDAPPEDAGGRHALDLRDATVRTWSHSRWRDAAGLGAFLTGLLRRTRLRERTYYQAESYLAEIGENEWSRKIRRDYVWRRRCHQLCNSFPNSAALKLYLRRKGLVATSEEPFFRVWSKILRVCLLAVVSLVVTTFWAWIRPLVRLGRKAPPTRAADEKAPVRPSSRVPWWLRPPVWALSLLPLWLWLFWPQHRSWIGPSAFLVVLPLLLFREVRACALLFCSVVNRIFTGNFTSPGRAGIIWVTLYAFAALFFWDADHLDIAPSFKKAFYEDAAVATRVCERPNRVTLDVCAELNHWDLRRSFLLATRFMMPVAPSMFDELDLDGRFADESSPPEDHQKPFSCAAVQPQSLASRCCECKGAWTPAQKHQLDWLYNRVSSIFHGLTASYVALVIRVLSSFLLTLLGATVASRLSRKTSP